ncbi:MAG: MBL fold metallo-hydrolase [Spirochaetales bacterium]|nr:MBL fold metallo-hydrolase [Spirochaetales bacterium]
MAGFKKSLNKEYVTSTGTVVKRLISGRCNVYLISGNSVNIIIDTSTKRNYKDLLQAIDANGISRIDYLIITHLHFDHIANAAELKKRYGLKILINKNAESLLSDNLNEKIAGTNIFTSFISFLTRTFKSLISYSSFEADILVENNFLLDNLGINGMILFTPGHTPHSISIIIENEVAIVGDTLFGVFKDKIFPPYAEDVTELIKSWKALLKTDVKLFLPGHGLEISRDTFEKEFIKKRESLGLRF